MRIGTRSRLRLRLLLPVVLVVSLAAPLAAAAETEPPLDRHAYIQVLTPLPVVYAGHPFTISGRLVSAEGQGIPTSTLHVLRTVNGITTALPDVIAAEDGTFSLEDTNGLGGVSAYYRFSWDGDDAHDPMFRTLEVLIRRVPVTITLDAAPASPNALDEVTISGAVGFGLGEQVSSPLGLTVQRREYGSLSRVDLSPVTTDSDGTFEFTDLPHGGEWLYEVTFAGDGTHERRTSIRDVDVRFLQAQVSVEYADGEPVRWGQESRYVGRVTALEGPAISSPMQVFARATGTCGGSSEASATTAPDGTFEFSIFPACLHDSELTVRSGGSDDLAPASTAPMLVSVAKGPPFILIDMAAASVRPVVTARAPTGIGASVPFWATGRGLMKVYATPYGQPKVRLQRVWLTNGEGPGFVYYPTRRTVFTAVYYGDEGLLAGSRSVVLLVRPDLQVTVSGWDSIVNGWRVFRHSTDVPHIGASSYPAHPGQRLKLVIQKRVNDTWRTVVSRSLRQDRAGSIETGFRGLSGAGNKYRVRTSWAGDVDHVAGTSYWRYFRFTR